jgi:hypothetical protein
VFGAHMERDRVYFSRRAQEERVAAMKTAHPHARRVHMELARRYDDLVGPIVTSSQRLGVDAVSGLAIPLALDPEVRLAGSKLAAPKTIFTF